jgi:predicted ferric reductase
MRARGPWFAALLCCVAPALWLAAAPPGPRFTGALATLISVGVLAGLAGSSAVAVNLVLGGRLQTVDRFFGGLDKVYRYHRLNGRIAFLLLLLHAALVIAGSATLSPSGALRLLTPGAGWVTFAGVLALCLMSVAIVLTLYVRLGHELFVYVQRSFGIVFCLAALHVFFRPGFVALSPALTTYLGLLSAAGLGAWIYRAVLGDVLVRRHEYDVVNVRALDISAVEITMSPREQGLRHLPGQFVYVTFYSSNFNAQFHPVSMENKGPSAVITFRPGEIGNQFHPFSITSSPDDRHLRVAVKAVGDFTTALQRLDEGAIARVEGPYGGFSHLRIRNRRQIWIAGGIGVTPFVSMARSLDGQDHEITLLYGMNTRAQGYFLDELASIGARNPAFRLVAIPEDEEGFISVDRIERDSGGLEDKDVLICGPPVMIESLRDQLQARGVAPRRIHFEKFGFTPGAKRR